MNQRSIYKLFLTGVLLFPWHSLYMSMTQFGEAVAYIREIKNETPFDAELYAESAMGDLLDLQAKVVSGRIIRLRSNKVEGNPYVRVVEQDGIARLIADGKNPDDTACHFMIQQYVNDDGKTIIGLRSCYKKSFAGSTVVAWLGTGEVFCTDAVVNQENQLWAQWEMLADPDRPDTIWLKNAWTKSWLEVGNRFNREMFEADPLLKSKLKGDAQGKEWADPWIGMHSTPDGTLRVGTPVQLARATDAAAFKIEVVANPVYPENFKSLFGGLGFEIAAQGDHILLLGAKGNIFYINNSSKGWKLLSVRDTNNREVTPFKSIAIGEDQTTYAVNQNGICFTYDWRKARWIPDNSISLAMVACANAKNIWGITTNKKVVTRTGNTWKEMSDLPNGYPKQVSVGVDGTVWVVGDDGTLYLLRDAAWTIPNYSLKASSISVGDMDNIVILGADYAPQRLISSKDFQRWNPVSGTLASIAITSKAQVVALGGELSDDGLQVMKGDLFQDSEIEPANSFDMTPYRWTKRENGFKIAGNSSVDLQRLGFTVKTGSGIMPGLSLKRNPEVRGYSYEKPETDFVRGQVLKLGSLWGRGYAWLEKSLATPGKATLVFRASTKSEGDLQVVMGEKVGNECLYRIIFGGDGNKKSVVLKEGETVLENPVSVDRDPRAATLPGAYELYWVSIDNGLIMAGKGYPGSNIFMARRDAAPPVAPNGQSLVRNLGFSSFKSIDPVAIEVTEVVTMPALSFIPPGRIFIADPQSYPLKKSGTSKWLSNQWRTPGEGTFFSTIQGEGMVRVRLAIEEKDGIKEFNGYEILLSSDGPVVSQIRRHKDGKNTLVSENKLYGARFNAAQAMPFWISCNQGAISVGHGMIGENPFMVWEDQEEDMPVKYIGLTAINGQATVANVQLAPPVEIGFLDPQMSYDKQYDAFKMPTSVVVVEPVRLQMSQMGSSLRISEKSDNNSFAAGTAAGMGKSISYRFTLKTDGTAIYEQLDSGKETKQRLSTQVGAQVAQGTANVIAMMAPVFSLGGPIGIAAGLALGSGGIALAAKAGKMQAAVDYAKEKDTEYVFQEDFVKRSPTGSEVPPAMQQYLARANAELEKADLLSPETPDGFQALLKTYQNITLFANNAYVSGDDFVKRKLLDGIDQLLVYYVDQPIKMYNDLLNVIVAAYNNMYLFDKTNNDDISRRQQWALAMSDIATQLFTNANEEGVTFKGLYGLYLWFNQALPEEGRGYIEFEAKGLSDVMIALSPEAFTTMRNNDAELYELAIGAVSNRKIVIRSKNLAKTPIAVFNADDLRKDFVKNHPGSDIRKAPNGMATPREFSKYAINIHDGKVAFWHNAGDNDNIPLFEWQDPYPLLGVLSVGLSCWTTPVTFRNVRVYPSLLSDFVPADESVETDTISEEGTSEEETETTGEEDSVADEEEVVTDEENESSEGTASDDEEELTDESNQENIEVIEEPVEEEAPELEQEIFQSSGSSGVRTLIPFSAQDAQAKYLAQQQEKKAIAIAQNTVKKSVKKKVEEEESIETFDNAGLAMIAGGMRGR